MTKTKAKGQTMEMANQAQGVTVYKPGSICREVGRDWPMEKLEAALKQGLESPEVQPAFAALVRILEHMAAVLQARGQTMAAQVSGEATLYTARAAGLSHALVVAEQCGSGTISLAK